jgi:uncharacterized repeat protein (TIGR01451 family)
MQISRSAIALAVTAALSAQALVGSSNAATASKLSPRKSVDPARAQAHFKYPVHSSAAASSVLYDQSGTAAFGFPSQNFESSYDAFDAAGADDFLVSDAAGWSVGAFNFQITTSQGDPTAARYDINVYPDSGGLPAGTASCAYSALPGTLDPQFTSLSVSLPAPCNLAQGTYWVSMVANLDFAVGGQVYWALSTETPAPGSDAAWENPGDGFGFGCTTWTDNATCGAGSGLTTALFQVIGSVGTNGTCTQSGICLESTVGTDLSPNACGTEHLIDATVGDQLNFCYTITNNSGVELDYHTLANNVEGTIFPLLFAPLPPGASLQSNEIRTVANTLTYNSTWTSYDVLPGYDAAVESGGGCGDRIFADGFGDGPSACGGFVDITGTGTRLGLGDDGIVDLSMPFSFDFYGTSSNMLTISNNGGAFLGAPGTFLDFLNVSLPSASLSAPAILPFWDDFDSTSGDVYYDVRGTAPNRQFIVEWFDRTHYFGNGDGATFELILDEAGTIGFEYADVAYGTTTPTDPPDCTGGACATIGLQGSAVLFDQFSAFQPAVTDNSGIRWTPTSPQVFTSTDSVTVNVGAPQIVVTPSPITGTVAAGTSTMLPFSIENHGNRDLDWSLTEAAPSNLHFAPPGSRYAMPMGDPSKSTTARAPFDSSHRAHKPGSHPHIRQPFAGVTAFAANVYDDTFDTLDVTANNGLTPVAAAQGTAFAFKFLDGDFSKAYGIDKFGSMSNTFAAVDASTGAITPIGTAIANMDSDGWTGFAQDPTTGTLYASGTSCGSSSHLYTIDRNTGAATPVGEMTGMGCAIWIAIGPDGLMYSVDIVNDALYAVDKTTGATSLKGSVGFNVNYGQDADFDQSTGILYWAAVNADTLSAEMRTVDLDTGASSLVYSLGATQIIGLATETLGGPCAQPQDLPWVVLDPLTGTTPPSGATPVSATIDATNANAGDVLEGTVCATSNDPLNHRLGTPITITVAAPPGPPTVSKSFSPTQVAPGVTSTLTITLGNTSAAPADLVAPLTDALPGGLVVAPFLNAQTTCVGNVTAPPGSDAVTLDMGSSIPAGSTCAVDVDVVAATPNDYANDIPAGALQTTIGVNPAPADATLAVVSVAPTLAKSFAPSTITAGTTSTLTITLANGNGVPVALTAPLTDAFPSGIVVAPTPNAQTTCGGSVTAAAGSGSVTLDSVASAIPAGSSCTVTVDVTAALPNGYTNDIPAGALQTDAGSNAVAADATLTVDPIPPVVGKAFSPVTVSVNNPSTLTITLGNANATPAALTAPLVDTFPTDLVVAATPNASTDCGGTLTAIPASGSVTLDSVGASIPAGGSCTITVDVESAFIAAYSNDIPADALQTDLGNNATPADATVIVTP